MSPQSSTPPVVIAKKTTRARRQSLALARSRRSSPPPNPNPPTTNPTSRPSLSRVVVVRARDVTALDRIIRSRPRPRDRASRRAAFPRVPSRAIPHAPSPRVPRSRAAASPARRRLYRVPNSCRHPFVRSRSCAGRSQRDVRSTLGTRALEIEPVARGDAFRRARRRGLARVPRHGSE